MSLLELLGTPAPIRTSFVTRWNSEYFRAEVQCPTCGTWQRKEHNSFCYYCSIWLVEQPTVQPVVTVEPVAVVEAATESEVIAIEQEATTQEQTELEPVALHAAYYTVSVPSTSSSKKQYTLTCQSKNGLAIDCDCPDRVKKGRFQGRACKHQMAHNATLKPAAKVAA